jgi:hypothetical protein
MDDEIRYFPPRAAGAGAPDEQWLAGCYLVLQDRDIVAVYDPTHYRSADAVVLDLLQRIAAGEFPPPWQEDYVVGRAGKVFAVVRTNDNSETMIVRVREG